MSTSPTADMDPTSVPLPHSDDAICFTSSPGKHSTPFRGDQYGEDYESSPPQTSQPAPTSRRAGRTNIFDAETPVISGAFNPFQTPYSDHETPRVRPSRRGGKYHPGTRSEVAPGIESSPGSVVHHSAQLPSTSNSDGEGEEKWDTDMETDELETGRTIAIGLGASVSQHLSGLPSSARSRRLAARSSPGRTPAKKFLGCNNDFTLNFTADLDKTVDMQVTPKASGFIGTTAPQSLFADILNTPFLATTSPRKLNAMQRLASNTHLSLSYDTILKEKEDEIRQLKEMLAGSQIQQPYDDFIEFSPEKKMSALPEDPQLTVKKRRSPRKNVPSSSISKTFSRNLKSSPIKSIGFFEGAIKPPSVEERKKARRRRETQEFRDFSAIDLDLLKNYLPQQPLPAFIDEAPKTPRPGKLSQQQQPDLQPGGLLMNPLVVDPMVEDLEVQPKEDINQGAQPEPQDDVKQEEEELRVEMELEPKDLPDQAPTDTKNKGASLVIPPINRTRSHRSLSVPPASRFPQDPNTTKVAPTPMDIDFTQESEIAKLNSIIANLRDKLETADVEIDRIQAELAAERRLRVVAEEAREFLEMEQKFGVCCEHNPGARLRKEKLGPAAIQLPNSSPPPPARTEDDRRPGPASKSKLGRLGDRPASRIGDRAMSRLGERPGDRPPTRIGGANSYVKNTAPVNKKRPREEPPVVPGRKVAAARPEKRILSAGAAAAGNIMLGSSTSSTGGGLSKKPEKVVGRSLRSTAGTTRPTALARGARR